jgi:arylsulfatase A-like enzyme
MGGGTRPNVIVVFCDDLGYGDVGCFGSTRNRTPRLDGMARQGVRLTDFHVASSVCSPSRAALLTGCYPKRIGLDGGVGFPVLLPGDAIGLDPGEITLATLLRSAGYRSKHIGKWHLGDQAPFLPRAHGFDSYFGLPYSNDMGADLPVGHVYGVFPPRPLPPLPLMRDDDVIESEPNQASLTDRYTAEVLEFIHESADAGAPFFLYLAHMYVHVPIHAPYRHLLDSQNGEYGAAVEHVDASLGSILDALDELGIADDTVVIFTSDNGAPGSPPSSNGELRGGKGTTWEGGFRVPCVIRWSGTLPAGECAELTTAMDLLPTVAAWAGCEVPDDRVIDGRDIGALLADPENGVTPHETFLYYGPGDGILHAIRDERWKLHLLSGELYDLRSDVGESVDLAAHEPAVVAGLTAAAELARADLGDAHSGTIGHGTRPPGRVENPITLTSRDDLPPLLRALYD